MNEKILASWNSNSEEYYQSDLPVYEEIIKNPIRAFPIAVYPLIKKYIGDLRGKKVCVPSSGDNAAVFGFHLLGANVTSCDFAEKQIKHAKSFADKQNWDIEFVIQDSMTLDKIKSNEYDLVYTSNGVHVWIDDMTGMYKNFFRVLKHGGFNIFFETHPMSRPFDNTTYDIKIKQLYENIYPQGDDLTFSWRTQDFINAIASAGFTIKEMQEFHSLREDLEAHNYLYIREEHKSKFKWYGDTFDWKVNPWAALPQCLCICSQKGNG
jgi:ubiquinone/menaquinone biosynthesis C-methylase UbiE